MHKRLMIMFILMAAVLSGCSPAAKQGENMTSNLSVCSTDSECETPAEYLLQSNCPFTSSCIEGKCRVVCQVSYPTDMDWKGACEEDSQCNCSFRAAKTLSCICHNSNCLSIEK